jgi:D-psicose/D-tagatose/L-ribulose 3-epimerase
MSLRLAYNTNGTQNHRLEDALDLIADSGYDGVALTLDVHHLDPFAPDLQARAAELSRRLNRLELGCVIETGARYVLDPRAKHEPTLVTPDPAGRARRVDFLCRAIDVAAICDAEAVSLWAGVSQVQRATAWPWLVAGLREVLDYARGRGVTVAVEPEPGMLVETVDDFECLFSQIDGLTLALDTGHCLVTGEYEPDAAVRKFAGRLGTVAIEDMRRGEHLHLPFGEGDMDVAAVINALKDIGFDGLVCVELSRDSHRAHIMVPAAHAALRAAAR